MNELFNELITDIVLLGEAVKKPKAKPEKAKKPSDAKVSKGGKWYSADPEAGGEYVGRYVGTKWIDATPEEKAKEKQKAGTPKKIGSTGVGAGSEKDKQRDVKPQLPTTKPSTGTKKPVSIQQTKPTKYTSKETTWLASQVFGSILSDKSVSITRGKISAKVRQVVDPTTGEGIDTRTSEGRRRALKVIDTQLQKLEKPTKDACTRLTQRGTPAQKQRIKKWLGNVGELHTLREMLAADVEAYLLPDSYPKNDLVVFTEDKERGLRVTEISVKSSTGEEVGKLGSNARVPLHAAVEGKKIVINGKEYNAEDAVDAAMLVYSQLIRFGTEGHIFGEERQIVVKNEKRKNFDKKLIDKAIELSKQGKKSAQELLLQARKITPDDVDKFEQSSLLGKNVSPEQAELTKFYLDQIRQQATENSDFRLGSIREIFTQQITGIIEDTGSSLSFESDLVAVKFSSESGYEGIKITPAEIMQKRVKQELGIDDFSQLPVGEQLKKLGGWRLGTRGLNTHHPKTREAMYGYAGAIINLAPPTSFLKPEDKLSPREFVSFVKTANTPKSKIK